jgi:hypothetical protein
VNADWNTVADRLLAADPPLTADEWRLAIAVARMTVCEGRPEVNEETLRRAFEDGKA